MNTPNIAGIGMTSQRTRERLIGRLLEQGIKDWAVLDIIRTTPRHLFLDEALSHRAYEDVALPIGYNQTISQPFIVAKMTEAVIAGIDPARQKLQNVLASRRLLANLSPGYCLAMPFTLLDTISASAQTLRTRKRLRLLPILAYFS